MPKEVSFSELCHFLPRQLEATKAADTHTYTLYGGSAGPGKLLDVHTPIPTPEGFKKMGDIQVGDFVISPRGIPVQVIFTSEVENNPQAYELEFDTGEKILCDARHLWRTRDIKERASLINLTEEFRKKRRLGRPSRAIENPKKLWAQNNISALNKLRSYEYKEAGEGKVRTTEEIAKTLIIRSTHNHSVDVIKPIDLPECDLLIDPYLFGLWLGDGFSGTGVVGMTEIDMDHISPMIAGTLSFRLDTRNRKTPFKMMRMEGMTSKLRTLGVYKNKHIPVEYLRSSFAQRMALLQGIMDTDGSCSPRDGGCEIGFSNKVLIEDTLELLSTLGIKARITKRRAKIYGKDCGETYRISFMSVYPVFRLARKLAYQKLVGHRADTQRRYIISAKRIAPVPMRCIQVDHPDGMYLVGRTMIATHNSYWLRWYPILALMKWGAQYNLKGIHGALFSKDYTTLKDRQVSKMEVEFPKWLGEIKATKTDGMGFHLHKRYGGHVLLLRNLDDTSKYLSSEFAIIAQEEATENDEDTFQRLRSRLRWTGIPNPKWIGATNPGGVGHGFYKKIFLDRDFPEEMKAIADQIIYVKALPADNPYLAASYLQTLDSMPEKLRKAYRDGNWDVFEGQYFMEWDANQHVVDPFTIPFTWFHYRSIDPSGQAGTTSCHWYAVNSDGVVYCYREYYVSGKNLDEHAQEIHRLSCDEDGNEENYQYTVIDTSAFARAGFSETAADIFERNGVTNLMPAAKERVIGWNAVHTYLNWDQQTKPKLRIFKNCVNLIRTLPLAQHDDLHPEDVAADWNGAEHNDALDDLRYFLRTLRDIKSPAPMSAVERRLDAFKKQNRTSGYDFGYQRK